MSSRSLQRIQMHAPVTLRESLGTEEDVHIAKLLDLSESGARIQRDAKHTPENEISFEWAILPNLPKEIFRARVVWWEDSLVGLQFINLNNRQKKVIQNLIKFHRP